MKPIVYSAPDFAGGRFVGAYHCGAGHLELVYESVSAEERDAYFDRLQAEGYVLLDRHTLGENLFSRYEKEGRVLAADYFPARSRFSLRETGKEEFSPAYEPKTAGEEKTATLWQYGRKGVNQNAPGMGYAVKLPDGTFLLVDSGPWEKEDEKILYDLLCAHKRETDEKPVVSLWMFSHPHGDHYGMASDFLCDYGDRIDLRAIGWNNPDFRTTPVSHEHPTNGMQDRLLANARAVSPNLSEWIIHAGERVTVGGATVTVWFTHEDLFPLEMAWVNHASNAWTLTVGGVDTLFLGDCEITLCQFMDDCYGDTLKSHILQASHHGFNGSSPDLYADHVRPEVSLFACDEKRFLTDPRCLGTIPGYGFNRFLRETSACYSSTYTTKISFTGHGAYTVESDRPEEVEF